MNVFLRKNAKKMAILVLGILLVAGVFFFRDQEQSGKLRLIDAPSFKLPRKDGTIYSLDSSKGEIVVLHFWATWCAPCLEELPEWVEMARRFEGRPIRFVAVSLDKSWAKAEEFLKPEKTPKNVVSVLDSESRVPELFGSFQFPETYLIAPDRRILSKWVGPQEWGSSAMSELFTQVANAVEGRRQ
ncbi:MAG: TlpA family protein disulfide reductase [Bdellovibrionales bacterium]|nr:TlpA family protein disulfide reductase [Bdellovibrionales bacterium]